MTEEQVRDYLTTNPDFFKAHSDILHKAQLSLSKSATSSLVEKRIAQLTSENSKLLKSAKEYLQISNENVKFSQRVHQFSLDIFKVENFENFINYLQTDFKELFQLEGVSIYSFFSNNGKNIKKLTKKSEIYRFNEEGRLYYGTKEHLKLEKFCDEKTQSIAIINIGKNKNSIMLLIGSSNINRFTPDKDHFFINNLQQIMDYKLDELTKKS